MKVDIENNVSDFYNSIGWEMQEGIFEDAKRFEDLRECSRDYVSRCRLRVKQCIPEQGEYLLDMASGPIQYKEYLFYSEHFKKRYCLDLSQKALDQAKMKLGDHGEYLCGSFFDIPLGKDFFDCAISLHTIYHIDKSLQEEAVRKLIDVTKPGGTVVIVYSNPYTPLFFLVVLLNLIERIKRRKTPLNSTNSDPPLYFFAYPISWWSRFSSISDVTIKPWRAFGSDLQKLIFPDSILGKKMLNLLFRLEESFPNFFVYFFQYPMIIMKKKKVDEI